MCKYIFLIILVHLKYNLFRNLCSRKVSWTVIYERSRNTKEWIRSTTQIWATSDCTQIVSKYICGVWAERNHSKHNATSFCQLSFFLLNHLVGCHQRWQSSASIPITQSSARSQLSLQIPASELLQSLIWHKNKAQSGLIFPLNFQPLIIYLGPSLASDTCCPHNSQPLFSYFKA